MKKSTAVLHLRNKTPMDVYQLGGLVGTSMDTNSTIFPSPDPVLTVFNAEVTNHEFHELIRIKYIIHTYKFAGFLVDLFYPVVYSR
jgi:hypothetical protein